MGLILNLDCFAPPLILAKRLLPYVVFYKGKRREYKEALNFEGKDVPYFFVVDPEGEIVYAVSGKYTTRKMQEIVEAVDAALGLERTYD